ncbi:diguanylate cyclase [Pseudomonas putida]|nr:diguanylate cyclase [Pseudomonas putida]
MGTLGGYRPPVGAGLPANTGNAGARHRLGLFTG